MRRLILYTRPGCHASLRAKALLRALGLAFTERDLLRHPLSKRELRALGGLRPLPALFAARSPLAARHRWGNDDELLAALAEAPGLVRRPLLRYGRSGLLVGFREAEWRAALSASLDDEGLREAVREVPRAVDHPEVGLHGPRPVHPLQGADVQFDAAAVDDGQGHLQKEGPLAEGRR